jgi:EAL domain-containing protein (putative c-di-GMP-specific phosphodiesterase class I)
MGDSTNSGEPSQPRGDRPSSSQLPVGERSSGQFHATGAPPSSGSLPVRAGDRRGRILIADDEPMLLRGLDRVLTRAGYEVVTANDGQQAAELLTQLEFDAIVSDISMPGLNGIQLLRRARETDLDVPVLLVTGAPAVETAVEALEYGAFQYLTKPVDAKRFEQAVEKAVQLHRMAVMKREALGLLGSSQALVGDRAGLETSFERAIETLWMAYQPIIRASNRTLFGYEALLRSAEPTLPRPGAILDAAERLERLALLGQAIRSSAAHPVAARTDTGHLFVNLHTRDLLDPTLTSPDSPLSKIAGRVVLEITERASLEEIKDIPSRVARLREMGFQIAIDDLGAGYAGLTSFALLEPEIVKLDMTLVRNVHKQSTKQKLIRSMTALCKDMGMMVVGEGVENIEERDALIELGCDLLQGYLFAKPAAPFPTFAWGT